MNEMTNIEYEIVAEDNQNGENTYSDEKEGYTLYANYWKDAPKKAIYMCSFRGSYARKYIICPECAFTLRAIGGFMTCRNCGKKISVSYRRGKIRVPKIIEEEIA